MKYFTREMVDRMHRTDMSFEEVDEIFDRYRASVRELSAEFTGGLSSLADTSFHDCENIRIVTSGTQVTIEMEGTKTLRSTDEIAGRHQLVFTGAKLDIIEPLHDPEYWLYEELSKGGRFWTYSVIMAWGQIRVEFEDCEVKMQSDSGTVQN